MALTTFFPLHAKPINIQYSILVSLFFCCIILGFHGCTFVPKDEHLITAKINGHLSRSNGMCTTSLIPDDWSITTSPLGVSPDSISILSWNIYKEQREGWKSDFERLSKDKEIILLQEAFLDERLVDLLCQKSLYWNLNSAFRYRGKETGVLMASTIQPIGSCGLRHNEPIIGLPKTILVSMFDISDSPDRLLVANIHGINFTLNTAAYSKQMGDLRDVLQNHEGPLILAGDFNNWNKKRTFITNFLMDELSLQIVTFDDEYRTTIFGVPVDHVFYRGLEVITQKIYPVASSDHNPLSVTFRLKKNKLQ